MQTPAESLTPRETAVLDLLRAGMTNKQIARAISVSEQTVKYHLKNVYGKLGALGRAHAVAISDQLREGRGDPGPGTAADAVDSPAALASGVQSPLALARRARQVFADRPAVEDDGLCLSYAEFFERCDRAAALFARLGVGRGDRVAVLAPNCVALLEHFYAVPQRAAVLVPLNARFSPEDTAGVVAHCEARVLCTTRHYAAALEAMRDRMPRVEHYVLLDGEQPGWIDYRREQAQPDPTPPPLAVADNDPLTINYTSGTGAHPKGVVLTHRNAWVNSIGTQLHWPLGPEDRYLWNLPMFHANGWGFVWTVTAVGATHVLAGPIEVEELTGQLQRHRITAFCAGRGTLAGLRALAGDPPARGPSVRPGPRVMCAAAAPAASLIERLETRWGWRVTHAYGLSEASPFVTVCEPPASGSPGGGRARYRIRARQGRPLLTCSELRVVDEEGQDVPADGVTLGEIVLRGPMVMQGYFRDPEATARVMAGGYLHTGDAAVMHADGTLEIRDRFKDIIISGDEIISSVEIEDVLSRHPAVQDVAVVGHPDEVLGERALAYVQPKAGSRVTSDEILAFAARHLSGLRLPAAVHLLDSLPRTATGKIQKFRLRAVSPSAGADPSG